MTSEIDLYLNIGTTFRAIMLCMISQAVDDLTGCIAEMQIRDIASSNVVTLSTTNGGLTLGGTAGTIAIWLTPTQTATLTPLTPAVSAVGFATVPASTTLSYDILVTLESGDVARYVYGDVYATPTVTQL